MSRPPTWRSLLTWAGLKEAYRVTIDASVRFDAHDGFAMAGYIAYTGFLSIFPFAIFATAVAGQVIGSERSDEVMKAIFEVAPDHLARTLQPVIEGVTQGATRGVLTVSGLGALWIASNAVEALRIALDRAYEATRPRHFAIRRLRGMGFVLLATATFVLMGFLIILAPLAFAVLESRLGVTAPIGTNLARYGVSVGVLLLFMFQLNLLLPSRRPPRQRLWPGIYVTVALIVAGATAFSIYLAYAPSYTITYGTFAGVIVTLLFFYLVGLAIIFGAEVNASLMERSRARGEETAPKWRTLVKGAE